MKNKIKKISALVCALIVVISAFATMPYYAEEDNRGEYLSCLRVIENQLRYEGEFGDITFPSYLGVDYSDYVLVRARNGNLYMILTNSDSARIRCEVRYYNEVAHYTYWLITDSGYCKSTNGGQTWFPLSKPSSTSNVDIELAVVDPSNHALYSEPNCIVDSSIPVYFGDYELFAKTKESYRPEIGHLQNIKFQMLYLEDDKWDMVEDTAVYKYSFSAITTTGLDITKGNWKVRHFKQLEIRDLDDDKQIHIYDKVFCNEYSASELKIMYPYKETNEKVHSACGFEGLSWWELEFKHYYMFYNDYLQLVRVNDDGSIDYGGCVRVWRTSNNITYTETLDDNDNVANEGYVDNPISGTHGSGGTYEEAEDDALENEEDKLKHDSDMSDLENALSGFTSTLGVIPSVIASVFSFLPPWCLNLCGVTFGLLLVLIVWKVVRG